MKLAAIAFWLGEGDIENVVYFLVNQIPEKYFTVSQNPMPPIADFENTKRRYFTIKVGT